MPRPATQDNVLSKKLQTFAHLHFAATTKYENGNGLLNGVTLTRALPTARKAVYSLVPLDAIGLSLFTRKHHRNL